MNLEEEIYGILQATGVKVYPGVAKQNASLPFIIYNLTGDERIFGLNSVSSAQANRFQVDIYTKTSKERKDISLLVETQLGLSSIETILYGTRNSNDEKEYRKTMDVKLWSNN